MWPDFRTRWGSRGIVAGAVNQIRCNSNPANKDSGRKHRRLRLALRKANQMSSQSKCLLDPVNNNIAAEQSKHDRFDFIGTIVTGDGCRDDHIASVVESYCGDRFRSPKRARK
jgi:hypothetical protein